VRVAVVGVGLIGGSIALAAHDRCAAEVFGCDLRPASLRAALERGALDEACAGVEQTVAEADAAFVAVPVGESVRVLEEVLEAAPERCVVSDVGSTKRAVVAAIDDPRFVGGHPLAGAESSGVEHARADLFEGATWYLTPAPHTSGVHYERLHRLLRCFGARPAAIEPDAHDTLLALVSHLPHVLANVLVAQAAQTLRASSERLPATGPSFRDATRVAGASSSIWTDIYLSNRDALLGQLEQTIERLGEVAALLRSGERSAITAWNDSAGADRRLLLEERLGRELRELRVSVPNRPGVVAQVALELARAGVNIVDLALYPAADMSEGVIALWIAGGEVAERAAGILGELGLPLARVGGVSEKAAGP
jgi:prephenate dehydrogenase